MIKKKKVTRKVLARQKPAAAAKSGDDGVPGVMYFLLGGLLVGISCALIAKYKSEGFPVP